MTLPGHVYTAPDGVRGFDTAERVTPSVAAAFRRAGYRFCIRYVRRDKPHTSALSAGEARSLLNAGIGLMLVQYVESDTSWIPSGEGREERRRRRIRSGNPRGSVGRDCLVRPRGSGARHIIA